MSIPSSPLSIIYVRVSDLCYFFKCPENVIIRQRLKYSEGPKSEAMRMGTRIHKELNQPYGTRYRTDLMYLLGWRVHPPTEEPVFQRQIGRLVVRGTPDNFEVKRDPVTKKIQVGIIENRTTTHDHLSPPEYLVKIGQAQIYMWLLGPELAKYPKYEYWINGHLDVYHQNPRFLIKRVPIIPREDMDEFLLHIDRVLHGEEPVAYPPDWYCKSCYQKDKIWCGKYRDLYPDKVKKLEMKLYGKLSSQ